ncbi:hypothetical protein EIP75_14395 [Aquabacterium soli]|jgi:hypothetical protein|uniref:Lipoprotein n=1 Tax=Aquabacterium soli TaxID=2493092 RepID=A0A426VAL9_9BURK|nr:hypothetical protein EIP75_14395 [Aquabacterium soli]
MHTTSTRLLKLATVMLAAGLFTGCATQNRAYDYSAFKQSRPRSILVLPPLNQSPDVNATASMLAQMTYPLAESGYYVLPVALVSETFKNNGLHNAGEIHEVSTAKLREIFGADAALYVAVTRYGATYTVFDSSAVVSATGKLVDLKSGTTLWEGSATASNSEGGNNNQGGLVGLLVAAVVKQIMNNVTDASHPVAGITSQRLLVAGRPNGMLYGPRSPNYEKD